MRLMMVAVPAPTPAMHDIFMAGPGHPFHDEDCRKHDNNDANDAHTPSNRRKVCNFEVQAALPHLISLQSLLWHFYYVSTANTV